MCVPVSAHMGVHVYVCAHVHVCRHCTEYMCMGMYAHVLACIRARVCVCVCVCVCALCACVKREENPDCLEISQNPEHASCQALVTAVAHRTEPLGKVSGHLGKGEEK